MESSNEEASHQVDDANKSEAITSEANELAEVPDAANTSASADEDICFICAEPVRLYSVPPCDHRVCHVCAMRLRALWKRRECTFCKVDATRVIFTPNDTKSYGSYTPEELPYSDDKLAIYFENKQDYDDTMKLLRFNCPKPNCEEMCSGWSDLKGHVKREHSRLLCDLCIKHKKIFAHEHSLFTAASLQSHLSSEHRYCEYCHEHFYSDDELWVHMRDRHEQCHICKAHSENEDERWKYYQDYKMLEQHFRKAHYLCPARECLERKFVVFENQMELQVHQVEVHGHTLSSRERRDALRVDTSFMYDDGPSRRRDKRPARDTTGQGSSRRQQFGRSLTTTAAESNENDKFWATVLAVLNDSQVKLTSCKAALHAYSASETNVHDLLKTVMNLTGDSTHAFDVGTTDLVIQSILEMLKNGEKRTALQEAWSAIKQEHAPPSFPSLAEANPHSVRTLKNAASGNARVWNSVARAASSTTPGAPPPRTNAQFPALNATRVPGTATHTHHVQRRLNAGASSTPWSGSSAKATPGTAAEAFPALGQPSSRPHTIRVSQRTPNPGGSSLPASQFPSLPSSAAQAERQAQKRELLGAHPRRNPLVPQAPPTRWGAGSSASSSSASQEAFPALGSVHDALPDTNNASGSGKQRRKKGVLLSSVGSMHHV